MKTWTVFDITQPILSEKAEQKIEANTAREAIEMLFDIPEGYKIQQTKSNSARFVVFNSESRQIRKRLFNLRKEII